MITRYFAKTLHTLAAMLLWVLLLCSCATATNKAKPAPSQTTFSAPGLHSDMTELYEAQVKLVQEQAPEASYDTLRSSYANSKYFDPWNSDESRAGIILLDAIEQKNDTLCRTFAEAVLVQNYTSVLAHYALSLCNDDAEHSTRHQNIMDGLLSSISNSGDGTSEQTAYVCTSANEVRDFLHLRGYSIVQQENVRSGFKQIERLIVIDETQDLVTEDEELNLRAIYFDTSQARLHSFKFKPSGGR